MLLDTHAVLWLLADDPAKPEAALLLVAVPQ
jgi:PIN domain nuclease of toxin-antitoxin system